MSFVSGLLGTAGGQSGTGIQGQSNGNILNPSTVDQANQQYLNANNALTQQQQFLQAVQAQNGLGNQSAVFNQLQGVANGTGPNPAQAMLNQQTGANVANQAALMAGQRGSSANPGMIARQAAQQGAAVQQQAVGQGASLQANQSLNALNQMGGLATNQANQQANAVQGYNTAAQGLQNNVLNGIASQNNANAGIVSGQNSNNAQLAGGVMKGQQQMLGGVAGGLGAAFGLAEGGRVPHFDQGGNVGSTPLAPVKPSGPTSRVGQYMAGMSAAPMPASMPQDPMSQTGNTFGKALGSGAKSLFGNSTKNSAPAQDNDTINMQIGDQQTAQGNIMPAVGGMSDTSASALSAGMTGAEGGALDGIMAVANGGSIPHLDEGGILQTAMKLAPLLLAAQGGAVPAMVSPGEKYLSPAEAQAAKKGANPMAMGETIPGKPKVAGAKNDYANDTVPKVLEEGGLVLPRSVTQSKNPQWAAHKFVQQHMMANGGKVGLHSKKKPKK